MKKTYSILRFLAVLFLGSAWVVSCYSDKGDAMGADQSGGGKGGSMARFTIRGDYMYTVDQQTLKIFNVSEPDKPYYMPGKDQKLRMGAETIFIMDTLLFIGSQDGLYIFNISLPDKPQGVAEVSHIRSCDPVVAQGNYAYVTLNSESSWCGRTSNLLQVYDISDPRNPGLLYEMTSPLYAPRGLGVDGNKLFICDRGVKVFDISQPGKLPVWVDDLEHIREIGMIDTYDLIPMDGLLLVIGADGLYQFDYTGEKLKYVSKIAVNKEKL